MKKVVVGIAAVFALLLVAAVAVPLLVPMDEYKPVIVSQFGEALGRDVRIDGPMRLSVFPRLALELHEVGVANKPGAEAKELASLDKLHLVLKLLPLLSGEVEVDSFVLERPVIAIEIDKAGKGNWVLAEAVRKAKVEPEIESASSFSLRSLGDVRVVDGSLSWFDQRDGTRQQFGDVSLEVSLADLDEPVEVEAATTWNARKVSIDVHVAKPRSLMEGGSSRITAHLESDSVDIRYAGEVANETPLRVDGDLDLDVPSVRKLSAWIGKPMESGADTLGPLKIKGRLALAGSDATFSGARLAIDAIAATGDLKIETGGDKPRISGKLAVDRLDLDPYLSSSDTSAKPAAERKRAGWSDDRVDLTGLQAVDADLSLSVADIKIDKIRLNNSTLNAKLTGGRLSVELAQFAMNKGSGSGKLMIDGSRDEFTGLAVSVDLGGFDAESLLTDLAGFDRISGTGLLDASLATRGSTERQMIESIQGKGRIDLRNGAMKGINLVAMVMHVATAFTAGDPSARTDFSEMGGTFTMERGVLKNNDMAMKSPLLEVGGAGTVDLGQQSIDYRITPRLLTPLVGQLGFGTPGVMVPVLIRGPWNNLRYTPDVAGMIREGLMAPVDIVEGVVTAPGKLFGGKKQEAPADGQKQGSAPGKAVDAIKGLFGR